MAHSQNGWVALPNAAAIQIRPLVVAGVNFAPGVAHHDYAATVLGYVAEQYHARVEQLHDGWCWGYYFRAVRAGSDLSNHSSGTAIDINAPLHPYNRPVGVNFTRGQIDEIHAILAEVNSQAPGLEVVRWGGDYHKTVDAMHFELNADVSAVVQAGKAIAANGGCQVKLDSKAPVAPSKPPTKTAHVPGAAGVRTINVAAVFRGNVGAPNDIKQVQRVLNAWYGLGLKVDGIYGDKTFAALDHAREAFGIRGSVSSRTPRRETLRKLGFRTVN